jgi:hypothetical protein
MSSPRTSATNPVTVRIVNPITGNESFNFNRHQKNIGDIFLLNITIENVTDLGSWMTAMKWNTSLLEYVGGTIFLFNEGFFPPEHHDDPVIDNGLLYCGSAAGPLQPSFSGSTVLAQITLRILGAGQSNLTFENDTVLDDSNFTDIPFSKINASFSYCLSSDINNDGIVNMADIMIIVQAFHSYPNTSRWNPSCDINQDNRVNMQDIAIAILEYGKSS